MGDETTRKKKAAALLLLMHLQEQDEKLLQGRNNQRRRRKPRSIWVRKWLSDKRRERYGHYSTLLNELKTEDEKAFYNYTRLPRGLTMRVAPNTISRVINEVCDAIKAEFAAEVIQCPTKTEEWTALVEQFEKRWQFPHCCGALDGKHVAVTCPWNTGSVYRNYKGFFSIVLMALVDADCKFLWIDVGSDGSSNDASIYNGSELKEGLERTNNIFNLPKEKSLPGDDVPVPYYIVGDNAFGINKRLMNPFSIRNMEHNERIFNYRLSRARRVVENAFGILAHKFRVLLRTMNQRPETCRKIITTCVILHNLIRLRYPATHNNLMDLEDQNQNVIPGAWRNDKVLLDVYHERARNTGTQEGRQIRRYLGHYFTSKAGSVPWQDKMIL
ncbi:putative nuclease HARBI1 [Apostichopus japonicus]|uniref:Putative nuclease HARBI1 n=1 Tax=Stichopus japonicus TaxID=307972 RepID=A0A2G8KSF5_STIJA|nr:putative nuclease HARBI1 [Apostichopus japonicus]